MDGQLQVNWDNFRDLNSAYVRLEGVTTIATGLEQRGSGRPAYIVSSDGGDTWLHQRDTALCFRNDRTTCTRTPTSTPAKRSGGPDPRDSTVAPPALGSVLNLQGHLTFGGGASFADFNAAPTGGHLQINPFLNRDLEVTTLPNVQNIVVAAPSTVVGNEAG